MGSSRKSTRNTTSLKSGGGGGGGLSSRTQYEIIRRFIKKSVSPVEYRDLESASNGGGVVAEPSKKKSVDSAINHFLSVD